MKEVANRILAEGEATGHVHSLRKSSVYEEDDGTRVFDVDTEDIVEHQEHGPITLPKEKYASDRVVEMDHFSEEVRRVQD